jgi:hypothetical protein
MRAHRKPGDAKKRQESGFAMAKWSRARRMCRQCRKKRNLAWDPEHILCYECKYPNASDLA